MTIRRGFGDDQFIWATRGRTWGFRFLRSGGFEDPLAEYERVFSRIGDRPEDWGRVADRVALRFLDPEGRKDASGRVIPHEFVFAGSVADLITSLDEGRRLVWPEVAEEFGDVWDRPDPPSAAR